jgi:hypothetical protein
VAFKTEMAIVQDVAIPIQPVYVVYVTPSLCRRNTLYPVIAEPPFAGATQFIITFAPEIEVAGAAGELGAVGRAAPLP